MDERKMRREKESKDLVSSGPLERSVVLGGTPIFSLSLTRPSQSQGQTSIS